MAVAKLSVVIAKTTSVFPEGGKGAETTSAGKAAALTDIPTFAWVNLKEMLLVLRSLENIEIRHSGIQDSITFLTKPEPDDGGFIPNGWEHKLFVGKLPPFVASSLKVEALETRLMLDFDTITNRRYAGMRFKRTRPIRLFRSKNNREPTKI